ncbi:TetR/AcrR family transcriptional regulator [Trinickia mobilis]|uniref:TetR/AcrR family transcriptional regulator n=1 Tax=Trinickia mobilis TaxID=2816356 RepID=UPI001A8F75B9|nr:TetR/AcrR family transcriptional regulator [Trinickia mobilis]
MSKREEIIEATKALLWQKGYEATSPRDIQLKSNAGQGSFYHHFPSKQALARTAIEEIVDERISDFEEVMAREGRFKDRISTYIAQNTKPLLGCRVGRLVWDSAIDDAELRRPLAHYFRHLETRLIATLEGEQAAGRVRLTIPAWQIALMIMSVVQGSYTVSRAMGKARANDARAALLAFLDLAIVD